MLILIVLILVLFLSTYYYATRNFGYWKQRNIYTLKPLPYFGNLASLFTFRKSIGCLLRDIYNEHKDKPYVGMFLADQPCLLVNDYEVIESIFQENFESFSMRIFAPSKEGDPLGYRSLFALSGRLWKVTRRKLLPAFNSDRMRINFNKMVEIADKFEKQINKAPTFQVIDMSERYLLEVIAESTLGCKGSALDDPENDLFRRTLKESLGTRKQALRELGTFLVPKIGRIFNIGLLSKSSYEFTTNAVWTAIDKRIAEGREYNDFMDLLLEQRKNGGWDLGNGERFELEGDNMVAQFFMFISGAYETTASALMYALFEIARNQEIQDKMRNEIYEVIDKKYNGLLSYDCLNEMKYTGMVLKETMRKYPPFPFLDRISSKAFKLPGTDVVIPEGMPILMPMLGLQNDERFWTEPDKFNPERFKNSDSESLKGKPYFPFSHGPRICIGMRFAIMELKLAIIAAVRNKRLTTTIDKLANPNPRRFPMIPCEEFTINVEIIK